MSGADILYIDTSALLPYYREEPVSRQVEGLLQSLNPPVLISDLTRVEFVSALARWVRMDEITEPQANLIESTFLRDIRTGLFVSHPLTSRHYRQAEKWLAGRKTSLRTLDALHLACCMWQEAEMVTCDVLLYQSAMTLGVLSQLIVPGRNLGDAEFGGRGSWDQYFAKAKPFSDDFPDHIEDLLPEEREAF